MLWTPHKLTHDTAAFGVGQQLGSLIVKVRIETTFISPTMYATFHLLPPYLYTGTPPPTGFSFQVGDRQTGATQMVPVSLPSKVHSPIIFTLQIYLFIMASPRWKRHLNPILCSNLHLHHGSSNPQVW